MPGSTSTTPDRARTSVAAQRRSSRNGERAAGGGEEGVAPHRHRRRAGVRAWPAKRSTWRSTPNVPSTTPSGSPMPLEHRALLDVQLEVGRARLAAGAAPRARGRARRRSPRARPPARSPSAVAQVAHGVGVERAGARADEPSRLRPKRAPSSSAQSTSLSVRAAWPARPARAAPRAPPRRRARRRASRRSAPSRGGRRRSRRARESPGAASPRCCPPRRVSTSTPAMLGQRARAASAARRSSVVGPGHALRAVRGRR